MDKSLYSKARIEDSQEICKRIAEDAFSQVSSILDTANKEKTAIIKEGELEADAKKNDILKRSNADVEKMRQKIFSTLNLEKRRLLLEEKSRFIDAVFKKVKETAVEFRKDPGYKTFLERSIIEGVKILGQKDADVLYSGLDEKIIKDEIIKDVNNHSLQFKKSDFKDIGVIVQSKDARLIFDNTFSAKLKRMHDEIYMDLLKKEF